VQRGGPFRGRGRLPSKGRSFVDHFSFWSSLIGTLDGLLGLSQQPISFGHFKIDEDSG
jgi:hypothetical protein